MSFPRHPLLADEFRVIAYRGGASERPENTMEAFQHAASLSADVVIELDIRRTVDGELVAMHDDDVSRTTDGKGLVSELAFSALEKFDAGYHFQQGGEFPFRGRGVRVPRIVEVLASFPNQCFVLDVHSSHPNICADIISLVQRHNAAGRVAIASEISKVVHEIRRQHPSWLFGGTAGELRTRVLLERARLDAWAPRTGGILMIPEVHGSLKVLSPRFVRRAHARGERVWVWVVEQVAEMQRFRGLGVDGVFTPCPGQCIAALATVRHAAPPRAAVSSHAAP